MVVDRTVLTGDGAVGHVGHSFGVLEGVPLVVA